MPPPHRPAATAQTWNCCPRCGHRWTDKVPTPGVFQRLTVCTGCRRRANEAIVVEAARRWIGKASA